MPNVDFSALPPRSSYDVVVSGAGPTGLSTAIAMRNQMRAEGRDPRLLVVEKRGPVPTRFQTFHLRPEAVENLRTHGMGAIFDGKRAVEVGQGWWAVPIKTYETFLRGMAADAGSGIDVVYGAQPTAVQQGRDGVELLTIASSAGDGAPSDGGGARAAGTRVVEASRLAVIAEGSGSSTARDILKVPRHDDPDLVAPMAVGVWERNPSWVADHGANAMQRIVFDDPDGTERTFVAIDHEQYGTTAMLQLPEGTPPDQVEAVYRKHAIAAGFDPNGLRDGPTPFTATNSIAAAAVPDLDRRLVVIGDYLGSTTPNTGSNFGIDAAHDVRHAVDLLKRLDRLPTGNDADTAHGQREALSAFNQHLLEAHREANAYGALNFAGSDVWDGKFGEHRPAPS